jgi:hypothetical protein
MDKQIQLVARGQGILICHFQGKAGGSPDSDEQVLWIRIAAPFFIVRHQLLKK